MSISNWVPDTDIPSNVDVSTLQAMATIGHNDTPNMSQLSTAEIEKYSYLMQKDLAFWQTHASTLDTSEITDLIRFFTLAEDSYPNWEAGEKSPVIFLNKLLKARGVKLEKTLLLWIKANSSNQFLPNGPISL